MKDYVELTASLSRQTKMDYEYSQHVKEQMITRGIEESIVDSVLQNPQQTFMIDTEICAYQSKIEDQLLRVFVNTVRNPIRIVTVYRTSKVQKYWR